MGKVLLSMELILLDLTSIPGQLMGEILCELRAERNFSTSPQWPHAGSAVPMVWRSIEPQQPLQL